MKGAFLFLCIVMGLIFGGFFGIFITYAATKGLIEFLIWGH